MSMYSIPEHLMPDVKQLDEMNREINALLPKELAGAVNMMAHPAAGFAAASALGIGVTSHAIGMWLGAVAGMAEASQRFFALGQGEPDMPGTRKKTPASRARATASTLIADAREAAKEVVEGGAKVAAVADGAKPAAEKAARPVAATTETAADLMPEDFRQPGSIDRPTEPDDLKKISGIGPKLETVLNGLGVWTYEQIANWAPAEIAWVDDYLAFKGRIGRDDWTGQAKKLVVGKTKH